jgi:hypothetical protein
MPARRRASHITLFRRIPDLWSRRREARESPSIRGLLQCRVIGDCDMPWLSLSICIPRSRMIVAEDVTERRSHPLHDL